MLCSEQTSSSFCSKFVVLPMPKKPFYDSENTSGRCTNFQNLVHHIEQTIVFTYIVVMLSLFNTVISLSL